MEGHHFKGQSIQAMTLWPQGVKSDRIQDTPPDTRVFPNTLDTKCSKKKEAREDSGAPLPTHTPGKQ